MVTFEDIDNTREYIYQAVKHINIAAANVEELSIRIKGEGFDRGRGEEFVVEIINMKTEFASLEEALENIRLILNNFESVIELKTSYYQGR